MSICKLCLQSWMGNRKETLSLPLFPHLFFFVIVEEIQTSISKTLSLTRHICHWAEWRISINCKLNIKACLDNYSARKNYNRAELGSQGCIFFKSEALLYWMSILFQAWVRSVVFNLCNNKIPLELEIGHFVQGDMAIHRPPGQLQEILTLKSYSLKTCSDRVGNIQLMSHIKAMKSFGLALLPRQPQLGLEFKKFIAG